MPLRNLNRISWPLIYLRVNISTPLLQQQNITRWDNLVLKTNFRSSIQILPRSVFLLNPLGLLWARFPYKFLRGYQRKYIKFVYVTFTRRRRKANVVLMYGLFPIVYNIQSVKPLWVFSHTQWLPPSFSLLLDICV